MALNPTKTASNPRIAKLIELEVAGRIKPEHQQELDTYRAQGVAPKKAAEGGTESERTAGFLATRVADELGTLTDIGAKDPGALRPGMAAETVRSVFGDTAANMVNSSSRQRAEAAQENLLDAALTLGTGAAYTKEQLSGYRRSLFPQIGDGDSVVADKRKRLKVLLEAAKVKAGGSAASIDKALAAAGMADLDAPTSGTDKTVAQDGITPLIDHLAGVNGPDKAPEFMPSGEVRIKHPDGTFTTYPSKLLYEQAATLGFSDNPTEQQRAEYKRKYGEEPGAISDTIVEGGRDVTAEDRDTTFGAVDAAVRGAADTVTLSLADELAAGATTLFGSGTMAENLRKERAIDRIDEKVNPYARMGGQLGGALLLPTGGARTPGQLAALGGGYGAGYGFGSGDSNGEGVLDRFKGGALGGGTGAALGWAGGTLADKIAARGGGPRGPSPQRLEAALTAQAADRQGIRLLPQDVGPTSVGRATQGTAQTPFGAETVRRAADNLYGDFRDRVGALSGDSVTPLEAGNVVALRSAQTSQRAALSGERASGAVETALGTPVDSTAAGQIAQRGVGRFMNDTAERAAELYRAVPIPPAQEANIGATRQILNDLTAEWGSNPQLGNLFQSPRLASYLDALTPNATRTPTGLVDSAGRAITRDATEGGRLSWQDLSEFRTRVGDMLDDPRLSEKIAPRQLRALYGALSTDMRATAEAAGPGAQRAWQRANDYYDGRMKRINDTFSMVVGQRRDATPNEAFSSLQNMLKEGSTGNASAFQRIMRSIPAADADTIRATIVNNQRGGPTFSPEAFSTAWGKLSDRGRSALLPQRGMRAIMDDAAATSGTAARDEFAGLSGEKVFGRLEAMASNKGDAERFQRTIASLSPDEAMAVRAAFIQKGGAAAPGSQNAAGDAFSINKWLTNWNTLSDGAKRTLFGNGELRSNMDDLALIAEKVKASEKLAGHSNTGAVNSLNSTTGGLAGSLVALFTGHPVVAAGLASPAVYQKLSANLLTSPKFVRWLSRTPKIQSERTAGQHIKELAKIAARDPAIATEVTALQRALLGANDNMPVGRAAASGPEGNDQEKRAQ